MFGNTSSDGYTPQSITYKPRWQKDIDRSPDHRPSASLYASGERPHAPGVVLDVFEVKGRTGERLGALLIASLYGVSIFTYEEIAHADW
jgi:hypothetical protein